jgi:hypothetical protein
VREWNINLIKRTNPHWVDVYPTLDPRTKSEDDG